MHPGLRCSCRFDFAGNLVSTAVAKRVHTDRSFRVRKIEFAYTKKIFVFVTGEDGIYLLFYFEMVATASPLRSVFCTRVFRVHVV